MTTPDHLRSRTCRRMRKGTPKFVDAIRAWLEKQDACTLHRHVRKYSNRNPYSVSNVMDVWECDLLIVQAYAKYNDLL